MLCPTSCLRLTSGAVGRVHRSFLLLLRSGESGEGVKSVPFSLVITRSGHLPGREFCRFGHRLELAVDFYLLRMTVFFIFVGSQPVKNLRPESTSVKFFYPASCPDQEYRFYPLSSFPILRERRRSGCPTVAPPPHVKRRHWFPKVKQRKQ
jgi:hypothetical protein